MRVGMCGTHAAGFTVKSVLLFVSVIAAAVVVLSRLSAVYGEYAAGYLLNAGTNALAEAVSKAMSGSNSEDFTRIGMDNEGSAKVLEVDSVKFNTITANVMKNLSENPFGGENTIKIPIGAILKNPVFASAGPDISVKVRPFTAANVRIKDNFRSAGINQVNHSLYIEADMSVTVAGAFISNTQTRTLSVPLTDTVIVGDVPRYYGTGAVIDNNEAER